MDNDEKRVSSISQREAELIREYTKAKLESQDEVPYEDLNDFEIPLSVQLSMLTKPAVSIKYKQMTFNMACIRLFEGVIHVIPSISRNKKRLAIIMRKEEGASTVQWARMKGNKYVNKTVTSLDFVESIYDMMGWDRNRRYKAVGRVANSAEGLILVFDLTEAGMHPELHDEYVDRKTGAIKKRWPIYYPDKYKGKIGKTYSEYVAAEQMSMFENLDDYSSSNEEPIKGEVVGTPAESDVNTSSPPSDSSDNKASVDFSGQAGLDSSQPKEDGA